MYHITAREKNIIESTNPNNGVIMGTAMSKTIRKYQIRDKYNEYVRIPQDKLVDKYYTDVAKSHDRKIRKQGLEEYSEEDSEDVSAENYEQ